MGIALIISINHVSEIRTTIIVLEINVLKKQKMKN